MDMVCGSLRTELNKQELEDSGEVRCNSDADPQP
jgi:hypothetical protein